MANSTNYPLVVDLDGTLTPTDTLVESLIGLLKQSPFNFLRIPFWMLKERSARGRRIVLATAAHCSIAEGVAAHLGLFS